jgi:hypothetical protein
MQNAESFGAPVCADKNRDPNTNTFTTKQKCNRQKQFLRFLQTHGPLSTRIISELVEPTITYRQARKVMSTLLKNGFIAARTKCHLYSATYYQICQRHPARERIARQIGCSPEELHQPYHIYTEGFRNDIATYWKVVLESKLANINIFRRHEIRLNETLSALFKSDNEYDKYLPHLLIQQKQDDGVITKGVYSWDWGTSEINLREIAKKHITRSKCSGLLFLADPPDYERIFSHLMHEPFLHQIKLPLADYKN